MKIKILIAVFVGTILLASCNALPSLGIGGAGKTEEELQLQEIKDAPTGATLTDKKGFREEFDKDVKSDWGLRVVSGLDDQLVWSQGNSKLRLQILPPNDVNFIFLDKKNSYKDVIVQAEVENFGPLDNAFSLVCRANADGWYEFRISSSGYYELLRFDQYKKDEGSNAYTSFTEKRIGSTLIKSGLDKNTFALSCAGAQITAFVNGEQLYMEKRPLVIEDSSFSEGSIGFGVLGYGEGLDMAYYWVEAVKP